MDKCVWEREESSDRGWFAATEHANEDSVHPSFQHVWAYCPYCGRPIEFAEAKP
jgi:hypothetical protein